MLKQFYRRFSSTRSLSIGQTARVAQQPPSPLDEIGDPSVPGEQKLQDLLKHSASGLDMKPTNKEDQWATSPYVQGSFLQTEYQEEKAIERVKMDPRDTSIILFPGYGSQFVGMARSLEVIPAAKDLFECASEVMG